MSETNDGVASPIETGNWLLDAILKPGSSMSSGTLSFLDKVFYLLFASILFLMYVLIWDVRNLFRITKISQVDERFPRHSHFRFSVSSSWPVSLCEILCERITCCSSSWFYSSARHPERIRHSRKIITRYFRRWKEKRLTLQCLTEWWDESPIPTTFDRLQQLVALHVVLSC